MPVRKAEIRYWIDQGCLEAVRKDQGRRTCYNISPEALQRCLREHWQDLQKRNIRSPTIFAVFHQFCYVPKHTVGEQLLQVREAKQEQAAYESATLFEVEIGNAARSAGPRWPIGAATGCSRCTCTLDRRRFGILVPA
jgi:hypothetical protein